MVEIFEPVISDIHCVSECRNVLAHHRWCDTSLHTPKSVFLVTEMSDRAVPRVKSSSSRRLRGATVCREMTRYEGGANRRRITQPSQGTEVAASLIQSVWTGIQKLRFISKVGRTVRNDFQKITNFMRLFTPLADYFWKLTRQMEEMCKITPHYVHYATDTWVVDLKTRVTP